MIVTSYNWGGEARFRTGEELARQAGGVSCNAKEATTDGSDQAKQQLLSATHGRFRYRRGFEGGVLA